MIIHVCLLIPLITTSLRMRSLILPELFGFGSIKIKIKKKFQFWDNFLILISISFYQIPYFTLPLPSFYPFSGAQFFLVICPQSWGGWGCICTHKPWKGGTQAVPSLPLPPEYASVGHSLINKGNSCSVGSGCKDQLRYLQRIRIRKNAENRVVVSVFMMRARLSVRTRVVVSVFMMSVCLSVRTRVVVSKFIMSVCLSVRTRVGPVAAKLAEPG